MSQQDNKKIAADFFQALDHGDIGALERLLHDDAQWWVLGTTKASGMKTKEKFIREFKFELTLLDGPFNFRLGDIVSEGNLVMLEVWGDAKLKSGGRYTNTYIYKLEIKDGQVIGIREFMDTALVDGVFGPRPPKKEKTA